MSLDRTDRLSNVSLQPTSASTSEGLRLSGWMVLRRASW